MRLFRAVFLVLCLPAIIWNTPLHSESPAGELPPYQNFSPWDLLNPENISYNRIMNVVWEVCYGDTMEKMINLQEMDQLSEFFIFLARNGIRDDDIEAKDKLEEDIRKLQTGEDEEEESSPWWLIGLSQYTDVHVAPALIYGFSEPKIAYAGWMGKKWKQTKKFVKNHRKEIIVAAVVVVVATVVIVATGGTGTPEAVVGGGAAIKAASDSKKDDDKDEAKRPRDPVNKPGQVYTREVEGPPQTTTPIPEYPRPQLEELPKELILTQSATIKEQLNDVVPNEALNIPQKDESTFWANTSDKARELGSAVAHTVVDGAANTLESAGRLGWTLQDDYQEHRGNFDEAFQRDVLPLADHLHQKIDQALNTNYAGQYGSYANQKAPESMGDLLKELGKDVAFCFVPVPGSQLNKLSKVSKTARAVVETAKAVGVVAATGSMIDAPRPIETPNTPVPTETKVPVLREQGNITVYRSFNEKTGEVNYVGITNNIARRHAEHLRNKGIDIIEIEGLTNLTDYDSHAVEQALIEIHLLEKNGGTLTNRINSIAKTNPKYAKSVSRGAEILREIEYDGLEEVVE